MTNKLKVNVKAGTDRIKYKSIFSYDSRFLFVPSGINVKILSITTGECLRDLVGHKTTVISVQRNPKIQIQIYTCSEDGEVLLWDYEDGLVLKRYNLNIHTPIVAFYVPCKEFSWFAIIKQEDKDFLSLFNFVVSAENTKKQFVLKPVSPKQNCIAFGPEAEYVAGVYDNELRVLHLPSNSFKRHLIGSRKLTCVACHPSELTLATGDNSGQILIWNNFLKSNHPSKSIYHWHTLPVEDLAFSVEGSYLYSGGGECVLVKWKIGTEVRHFLPRMGYPIKYVTVSPLNSFVASSHIDNGIYLINAQNKIERMFQGLTQNCLFDSSRESPSDIFLYDSKNHALILAGKPGSLQFYNPIEDSHLFSIDVIGENIISQERNRNIANTVIDRADIDNEGIWLATIEYRDDKETSPNIRLKFWKFVEELQKYQLDTNIFLPHKKRVRAIKFRPQSKMQIPMAVTVGEDKLFKLWSLSINNDEERKELWNCLFLGYYHDLIPNEAAFSEDGSILAVAFEHIVTLWDSNTCVSLSNLYVKSEDEIIQQMLFGRELCSHLLICLTKENIKIWNLLTLTVSWEVQIKASCLTMDPKSNILAVFNTETTLFVFEPDDPKPKYIHRNASRKRIISSVFFPWKVIQEKGWQKHSQLYYMNEDQELMTLTEENEFKQDLPNLLKQSKCIPSTPFAKLVAEHQTAEPIKYNTVSFDQEGILGEAAYSMIANVPSHIVPHASVLCYDFLSSMVERIKQDVSEIKNEHGKKNEEEEASTCNTLTEIDKVSTQINLKCILSENYDWLEVR